MAEGAAAVLVQAAESQPPALQHRGSKAAAFASECGELAMVSATEATFSCSKNIGKDDLAHLPFRAVHDVTIRTFHQRKVAPSSGPLKFRSLTALPDFMS